MGGWGFGVVVRNGLLISFWEGNCGGCGSGCCCGVGVLNIWGFEYDVFSEGVMFCCFFKICCIELLLYVGGGLLDFFEGCGEDMCLFDKSVWVEVEDFSFGGFEIGCDVMLVGDMLLGCSILCWNWIFVWLWVSCVRNFGLLLFLLKNLSKFWSLLGFLFFRKLGVLLVILVFYFSIGCWLCGKWL